MPAFPCTEPPGTIHQERMMARDNCEAGSQQRAAPQSSLDYSFRNQHMGDSQHDSYHASHGGRNYHQNTWQVRRGAPPRGGTNTHARHARARRAASNAARTRTAARELHVLGERRQGGRPAFALEPPQGVCRQGEPSGPQAVLPSPCSQCRSPASGEGRRAVPESLFRSRAAGARTKPSAPSTPVCQCAPP